MADHYILTSQTSLSTAKGDSTFVGKDAAISYGVDMRGDGGGDQSVTIYGTLFGSLDDYAGTTSGNDQIFIGATGSVNTDWFGAVILGGGGHRIVNLGTVSAMSYGNAVEIVGSVGAHQADRSYITNSGTISAMSIDPTRGYTDATIYVSGSAGTTLNNSGSIISAIGYAVTLGGGNDVVDNTGGFIQGGVLLGDGADFFDSRQGTITGEILGYGGDDTLFGSAGDNRIVGGDGNDRLDGHLGADTMFGGAGNDTYTVDNADDIVNENDATYGGGGSDTIQSSISFDLSDTAHVIGAIESLVLTGAADLRGFGSARSETIKGNAGDNVIRGEAGNDKLAGLAGDDRLVGGDGNDTLNGGGGEDTMFGGAGNDTYAVDNAGDVVDETVGGSGGTDLVLSAITFRLDDTARVKGAVENLTLQGTGAISGVGNALANTITGNSAANLLDGGAGNDKLIGGGGADKFRFTTALSANLDTIADFTHNTDKIVLDSRIFTRLSAGALSAGNFAINAPADANDYIIYNTTTGVLSYDTNGSAAGGATAFAKLTGVPGVTQADFQIV